MIKKIVLFLGVVAIVSTYVFIYYGGFTTGKSLDVNEFKAYAKSVDEISIPQDNNIIALGEATHGNKEFQQLKLEIFKKLVEENHVRSFALEADCGGCEEVNQYIQGGDGTTKEIVKKLGFQIYQTEEMVQLIEYMRAYNQNADENNQLRFYGFDMQRIAYSVSALKRECINKDIDTFSLDLLVRDGSWNQDISDEMKKDMLMELKTTLEMKESKDEVIHCVDMLLQNLEVMHRKETDGSLLRDQYMAENVAWILQQEQIRGNHSIFISGHNEHVAKWGSYDSMGKLLSNQYRYYVIGTDFYKTRCNLPAGNHKRTIQTFYSHDPLAKTAKLAGFKMCWIDFSSLLEGTEIKKCVDEYTYMGTLGESYSIMNRFLPPSYRMFQPPTTLYDSMIYVSSATPTKIIE